MHVSVCACLCAFVSAFVCVLLYVYTYVYMYAYVYAFVYVRVHVRRYVYVSACISMHAHTHIPIPQGHYKLITVDQRKMFVNVYVPNNEGC